MSRLGIQYVPIRDATTDGEISALASVYRFLLERKEAVPDRRPEDARKDQKDAGTHTNCT